MGQRASGSEFGGRHSGGDQIRNKDRAKSNVSTHFLLLQGWQLFLSAARLDL